MRVVTVRQQLARPQLNEDDALHDYFFRAQEMSIRLEHAREKFSETLVNAMVLKGLPERHEHFVMQESSTMLEASLSSERGY